MPAAPPQGQVHPAQDKDADGLRRRMIRCYGPGMGQIDLAEAPPSGELLLDPFAYQAGVKSRIEGLGGTNPSDHDPNYAFHTLYVDAAEGPVNFIVRFTGLTARRGSLQLRVHMVGDEPRAILVNSARIQLNRLVAMGGETSIRFEGFRGVTFALYGGIVGDTDAAADGLMVTLDRPADGGDEEIVAEARNTSFRREDIAPQARLLSLDRPLFAQPVCQPGTTAQLREPAFDKWVKTLGVGRSPPRTQWARAFVLQALDRYGALQPGARGLRFGDDAEGFRRVLDRLGVHARSSALPASPDTIPRHLLNFDFLWSIDMAQRFGSPAIGQWFIDASLRCLRPGGLAVHIVPFDPLAAQRDITTEGPLFGRGDVERIALGMISRENEVAQVKLGAADLLTGPLPGNDLDAAAFGIIVRKAPLPV
jgi:hypothetical protein